MFLSRRSVLLAFPSVLSLATIGCDSSQSPATVAPAATPAKNPPPPPPPAAPPVGDAESARAAARKVLQIRLTTGVSLAQTTADGTLMSFSVDYEFLSAPPNPAARHALMIRRGDGQSVMQEQQLQSQGNLSALVPGWRPEDAPFEASIVQLDANDQPIAESETLDLTGP